MESALVHITKEDLERWINTTLSIKERILYKYIVLYNKKMHIQFHRDFFDMRYDSCLMYLKKIVDTFKIDNVPYKYKEIAENELALYNYHKEQMNYYNLLFR